MADRRSITTNALLGAIVIFLAFVALYATRPVIVPLLFGLFLAVLVQPLVSRLNTKLPYWLSLSVALLALVAVAGAFAVLLVVTVNDMAEEAPKYTASVEKIIAKVVEKLEARGIEVNTAEFGLQENMAGVLAFIGSSLSSVFDILGRILVVIALGLFAIFEARRFEQKIVQAFGKKRGEEILAVLGPMAVGVGRYLRTKTIISVVTGFAAYLLCLVIGIELAFLWGLLVFILNYLPYIGPVIAIIPAILVAFLQDDSIGRGIIAAIALGASQVTSGILLEPQIMGHSFRISALFVLVSMLFWAWLWGLAGVVLAIPVSAAIVIGCAHIEKLKPVAVLLGAVSTNGDVELVTALDGKSSKPAKPKANDAKA